MVLATGFAAIRGVRAGIPAPLGGLGERGVDQAPPPVDPVGPVEFGEQHRMQLGPDAGLVPAFQILPAGLTATAAQFRREVLPGDAGLEDEQDAGQDLPVIQRLASGKAEAALGRAAATAQAVPTRRR